MERNEKLALFERKVDMLMLEARSMGISVMVVHASNKEGLDAIAVHKHVNIDPADKPAAMAPSVSIDMFHGMIEESTKTEEFHEALAKALKVMKLKSMVESVFGDCNCPKCSPKH